MSQDPSLPKFEIPLTDKSGVTTKNWYFFFQGLLNSITGGVTKIIAGTNVTISPTDGTGDVTINATGGSGSGTVTSVATGTGLTGGPITTTGTVALANTAVTPASYTNTNLTVDAQGRITSASNGSGGSGTVTSVALSDASTTPIYTVSGSPVTTSGTLTETLKTQTANTVFSGPTTGSAAQPAFRALVTADIPFGPSDIFSIFNAKRSGIIATNGTGIPTTLGAMTYSESVSVPSNPAADGTGYETQFCRRRYTSAVANNSSCTVFWGRAAAGTDGSSFFRLISANAAKGGFKFQVVMSPTTAKSGQAVLFGVNNATSDATLGGIVSTTYTNYMIFGQDQTDTNLQFITRQTSTVTKVDLGVTWASFVGHVLRMTLTCLPGGTVVSYLLEDLTAATNISGTQGTTIPAADVKLGVMMQVSTGNLTTSVVAWDLMRAAIEVYDV